MRGVEKYKVLDFSKNGHENSFRKALSEGINLFCGAGFSYEAYDCQGKRLMLGFELLEKIKEVFPSVKNSSKLSLASSRLIKTDKEKFYSCLGEWFKVGSFNDNYLSLLKIKLKNIYTTNIDDLFFKIFERSKNSYLNDASQKGAVYNESSAVNYFPLHGCIRHEKPKYIFSVTEIASAFSQPGTRNFWRSLAQDSAENSMLFWGWNFEDTGPLEAMFSSPENTERNIKRWFLMREFNEEMYETLRLYDFNIIIGDTAAMLEYLSDYVNSRVEAEILNIPDDERLKVYNIPEKKNTSSYPLEKFFSEYTPQWSHIYFGKIPYTEHYTNITDDIASGKNVIVIGIRGSGKTTLCMQLAAGYNTNTFKHFMIAPSVEQAEYYIKILNGRKSLLFVDDCFRDTNAVIALLKAGNIQLIGFDRDFNYERQHHKIKDYDFAFHDVTVIEKHDAQKIVNIIPNEIKRFNIGTKYFENDKTILSLLANNLKVSNFSFIKTFCEKDYDAARLFMMIAYVHSCGTPCSFDMIYYFLGGENYSVKAMQNLVKKSGKLIKDASDWFMKYYDLEETLQDYYQCRSRFLAEKIIWSIPEGSKIFGGVLKDFAEFVPVSAICLYDKFRRSASDAGMISRVFPEISDGEEFYELCRIKDDSEYIYQQAALYFSRLKDYTKAFKWIEDARNLANYNRFSIDSTYAEIYFDENLGKNEILSLEALDILINCCRNDKRRAIHFIKFAKCCLKFRKVYPYADFESYLKQALIYIQEGLDDKNKALSSEHKRDLESLRTNIQSVI